jgi:predicted metal-binding protein
MAAKRAGSASLVMCTLCTGETLPDDERPDGQHGRLKEVAGRCGLRLQEVECLDQCDQGDVVVARPAPAARRRGAKPHWFAGLAGDEASDALETWLAHGGPGTTLPPTLDRLRVSGDG